MMNTKNQVAAENNARVITYKNNRSNKKLVVVAGLGLLGGSIAKALKKYTNCTVYGWNRTKTVAKAALAEGAIDGIATDEIIARCDLMIPVLSPKATIDFLCKMIPTMKKGAQVVDFIGIKKRIIDEVAPIAKEYGIHYIGGHPMAGLAKAGFERSFADLFQGTNMILVPTISSDNKDLKEMTELFTKVGFSHIEICDSVTHDRMIAHTSQLAHVVCNSYIKSTVSPKYVEFAGGSYKDMTRCACLNEKIWKELFLLNKEALLPEIDKLIEHIMEIRNAIAEEDENQLEELLRLGREAKEKTEPHRCA